MNVTRTALPEVLLITPRIVRDDRGAFWETWNQKEFAQAGLPANWVQDNCSLSRRNVIRGIHYQIAQPQAKLVRVTRGSILDVAVDLRRSSPMFGQYVAVELSAECGECLYIPIGFGHGFAALSDTVGLAYRVSDFYCPAGERTLLFNDPNIRIEWPVPQGAAIVSDKDLNGKLLGDLEVFA